MRYLYITLTVVVTALVLVFMLQNIGLVTVSFFSMSTSLPLSILAILIYVLGMLTGGSVLMLVRSLIKGVR